MLLKVYKVPKAEIATTLSELLGYEGIINDNRAILIDSLQIFISDKNVDIVDAIVHTTAEAQGWTSFNFDDDLRRLSKPQSDER